MNLQRTIILTAAAMLMPLAAQSAGTTGLSSYLRQIPAPPKSAQEAYQGSTVDDARVVAERAMVEITPPAAFTTVQGRLTDESVLATGQSGTPMPTVPGMGIPTDAASAQAMAQALQNMTPAQQQAMAQQMMAQSNAQMRPGAMTPEDQQMAARLGQRQQGSMARMQKDLQLQQQWSATLQRWDVEHNKLNDAEQAEIAATVIRQCPNGSVHPHFKIRRKYADQHVALVLAQIKDAVAAHEQRRVVAVDEAGFADQLAPLALKAQGPLSRQGYSAARNDAVRSLASLLAISEETWKRAAYWYMVKRSLTRDEICDNSGG